jgi:YebC/PmpR family DNA-binding regulatory protein
MAGHSKWKQIKHYKAATDAKRGALFTKLIREITVAAKQGGGDPDGNPRLRTAIDAAKASSMPKENIERAIKKGTGELEGVDYVEVLYEAYGPGGVALMIQALTDNPTRTVAEVRHKLARGGGNLGTSNSVSWMFDRKGQMLLDAAKYEEDAAMEAALEAGAEDFQRDEDNYVVTTEATALHAVKDGLEAKGLAATDAAINWVPKNTVRVEGGDAQALVKLLESLEDLDDVQRVERGAWTHEERCWYSGSTPAPPPPATGSCAATARGSCSSWSAAWCARAPATRSRRGCARSTRAWSSWSRATGPTRSRWRASSTRRTSAPRWRWGTRAA